MIGAMNHPHLISRAEIAFGDYSQVSTGSKRLGKTADRHLIAHPDSKSPARNARFGYFEDSGSNLPSLSDQRIIHRHPFGREVLAEFTELE